MEHRGEKQRGRGQALLLGNALSTGVRKTFPVCLLARRILETSMPRFPCCHGEYNTKLHSRPSSYYSFAFPFPSNIIDIIDNPSISCPYHNVHLAPKAEVAQLYILITPTPRSNGYALTLGYNEGSGGSVLV